MAQQDRNWEPPDRLKIKGSPTCKHANHETVIWHQTAVSPREGRPVLGYVVTRKRQTTICSDCPYVETETLEALQPLEGDLQKHFKGKAGETMLRRLKLLESEQASGKPSADPEPAEEVEDDVAAAFAVHGSGEEDALEEVPLGDEEVGAPEVPKEPDKLPEGFQLVRTGVDQITLTTVPKALTKDFWKALPAIKRLRAGDNCWRNPSDLLTDLMKEAHEVTTAHSQDHLKARLVKLSAHITTDIQDITEFLKVILNTSGVWSPMTCRLASEWGLVRLPNGDSWMPYESMLCHMCFDNWLCIPHEEVYPHDLRKTPTPAPAPDAPPVAELPPTQKTSEILQNLKVVETLAQAKETRGDEAHAAMFKGILELGPVPAPGAPKEAPIQPCVEIYPLLGLLPGHEAITEIPGTSLCIVNLTSNSVGVKMVLAGDKLVLVLGAGPVSGGK